MRRNIVKEFDDLAEALSSFCAMFTYRIMNLCVKAEEASLLPVKVMVEGELLDLEKCAIIAKKGDYEFMIFPKFEDDMMQIGQGILNVHPEFKQKIDTMKVDTLDSNGNPTQSDAHYISVTMPEVDNNRYDALKDGVKSNYEICKAQMENANLRADARLAELTVGETKENLERIEQERDKLNQQWNDHRDKLYQEKLQEIEDAHNKWLEKNNWSDKMRKDHDAASNDSAAYSMKMIPKEE